MALSYTIYYYSIMIKKKGNYTITDTDDLDYTEQFKGQQNPLILSRFYNTKFICKYNMAWYPFDTQRCSMIFQVDPLFKEFVKLDADQLIYTGSVDLMVYFIKNKRMANQLIEDLSSVRVEIVLGRRLLSTILTTIVPTILLNIVSYKIGFYSRNSCS